MVILNSTEKPSLLTPKFPPNLRLLRSQNPSRIQVLRERYLPDWDGPHHTMWYQTFGSGLCTYRTLYIKVHVR